MDCPAIQTGTRFVAQAVAHIDCQAQAIGAYGFGALSDPHGLAGAVLTGLLTLFVALFGLQMMIGKPMGGQDLAGSVIKLGIVLTLATSWPAWRTLGYETVLKGPGELVSALGGSADLPGSRGDLVARMQAADDGIVLLTVLGTGREMGGEERSQTIGDSFRGMALPDREGFASGRIAFLAGTLGPLALVRLGAGLLLALAPLAAGLLLFAGTRDLFFGWLRALGALALGAAALAVITGVELAMLEPWLRDALAVRDAQVYTPSAPTELVAMTYSFAFASLGMLAIIAKIMFFGGFGGLRLPQLSGLTAIRAGDEERVAPIGHALVPAGDAPSRAFLDAEAVSQSLRREDRLSGGPRVTETAAFARRDAAQATSAPGFEALGETYRASDRRRLRRASAMGDRRDSKT